MSDIKDFKGNFALPDALELNPGKKQSHLQITASL